VETSRQRQLERFSVGAKQLHSEDAPHNNGVSPQSPVQSNADMVGIEHRCPAEVRQYCALVDPETGEVLDTLDPDPCTVEV
jgi:hypothetical protein